MSEVAFKNLLKIPYINFKFILLIILLSLITIISPTASFISIIISLFLSFGLVGANIFSTLKNYDGQTVLKILELSTVYFVSSLLFIVFEFILLVILFIPVWFLKNGVDVNNITSFNSTLLLIILIMIIFILGIIILESLKNFGFLKYARSENFDEFFKFKRNIKLIFTKDFLTGILLLIGYFIFIFFVGGAILILFSLISATLGNIMIGILTIFTIYIFSGGIVTVFNEVYKAHK